MRSMLAACRRGAVEGDAGFGLAYTSLRVTSLRGIEFSDFIQTLLVHLTTS